MRGCASQSILARKGDCVMVSESRLDRFLNVVFPGTSLTVRCLSQFRSDVWHRGSKNISDRTRHIIQVHLGLGRIVALCYRSSTS
jgi:hypothetical protein